MNHYITLGTWEVVQIPPDSRHLKVSGGKLQLSDGVGSNYQQASNSLSIFFYLTHWANLSKSHLESMVIIVMKFYNMDGRINIVQDPDKADITISVADSHSRYVKAEKQIYLHHESPNPLTLIHELTHACIAQLGYSQYGTHANSYVLGNCNNLLVFHEFTHGLLLDPQTAILANFPGIVISPSVYQQTLMFPELSYFYNAEISMRCEKNQKNKNNGVVSNNFLNPIIQLLSSLIRKMRSFTKQRISGEYQFILKYVNKHFASTISEEKYIQMNLDYIRKYGKNCCITRSK